MVMNRREFIRSIAAAASALPLLGQETARGEWGGPVVDCHHHLRRTPEANIAHLDGSGISNAMALARDSSAEQIAAIEAQYPSRIVGWFASTDISKPEAEDQLARAVKSGAIGFGELKFHVAAAGPELRRVYALAADFGVPVLVHFQEVPHTPTEGTFATASRSLRLF